jgi:hypothetical protein
METPRPQQFSHHRIFDSDAPQSAKVRFEAICDALDFDMDRAMCKEDVRHMIQARGSEEDQALIRELRQKLGLTKNSTVLTALRIGLGTMKNEIAPTGLRGGG